MTVDTAVTHTGLRVLGRAGAMSHCSCYSRGGVTLLCGDGVRKAVAGVTAGLSCRCEHHRARTDHRHHRVRRERAAGDGQCPAEPIGGHRRGRCRRVPAASATAGGGVANPAPEGTLERVDGALDDRLAARGRRQAPLREVQPARTWAIGTAMVGGTTFGRTPQRENLTVIVPSLLLPAWKANGRCGAAADTHNVALAAGSAPAVPPETVPRMPTTLTPCMVRRASSTSGPLTAISFIAESNATPSVTAA